MKYTKRLDEYETRVAVELIKGIYGRFYCKDAKSLALLVSDEFDCNCLPEDVEQYVDNLIEEELDTEFLLRNIFN